jgi:hypothetical protein
MSDWKDEMGVVELLGVGLLGGAMGRADIGCAKHTVCADCASWVCADKQRDYGLCGSALVSHATDPSTKSWGPTMMSANGPLWPGCRGFKHRPGTTGPQKRWAAAVRAELEAAQAAAKKIDDKEGG